MEGKILNQNEIAQAQSLMQVFKERYQGKEKSIKTEDLLFYLKGIGVANMTDRTLRRILGYIRENDLMAPYFIVSNVNHGYWLSKDEREQNTFLDQQLNRMSNQFSNVQALHMRLRNKKQQVNTLQTNLF